MDRVFSVGEISDQFWSPLTPPKRNEPVESSTMNRSESEWALQRFLREEADPSSPQMSSSPDKIEIKAIGNNGVRGHTTPSFNGGDNCRNFKNVNGIPADPEEYQAFLKSQLNLACAAVASSRASFLKPQDSPVRADSGSQASNTVQLGSHAPKGVGNAIRRREKDANGLAGISSLPAMQKKLVVPVMPATSGSSREVSEDDENEAETENIDSMDPADAKHVRRMLSNRESARRSRRRKQAHLTDIETQVSQLRVENSTLLKRFTDISHKYNKAAVDNRVLKADVETLRAKVKMAEEMVKRITGLNPMFHAMPETSATSIPSFDGSPSDTSADAAVPVPDEPEQHHFYQSNPSVSAQEKRVNTSSVENMQKSSGATCSKMGRTASLQRVASLEHLQKRIRGGGPPSNADQ